MNTRFRTLRTRYTNFFFLSLFLSLSLSLFGPLDGHVCNHWKNLQQLEKASSSFLFSTMKLKVCWRDFVHGRGINWWNVVCDICDTFNIFLQFYGFNQILNFIVNKKKREKSLIKKSGFLFFDIEIDLWILSQIDQCW